MSGEHTNSSENSEIEDCQMESSILNFYVGIGNYFIGRTPTNDIVLDFESVREIHAELCITEYKAEIRSLASECAINKICLKRGVWMTLSHNDDISFNSARGKFTLLDDTSPKHEDGYETDESFDSPSASPKPGKSHGKSAKRPSYRNPPDPPMFNIIKVSGYFRESEMDSMDKDNATGPSSSSQRSDSSDSDLEFAATQSLNGSKCVPAENLESSNECSHLEGEDLHSDFNLIPSCISVLKDKLKYCIGNDTSPDLFEKILSHLKKLEFENFLFCNDTLLNEYDDYFTENSYVAFDSNFGKDFQLKFFEEREELHEVHFDEFLSSELYDSANSLNHSESMGTNDFEKVKACLLDSHYFTADENGKSTVMLNDNSGSRYLSVASSSTAAASCSDFNQRVLTPLKGTISSLNRKNKSTDLLTGENVSLSLLLSSSEKPSRHVSFRPYLSKSSSTSEKTSAFNSVNAGFKEISNSYDDLSFTKSCKMQSENSSNSEAIVLSDSDWNLPSYDDLPSTQLIGTNVCSETCNKAPHIQRTLGTDLNLSFNDVSVECSTNEEASETEKAISYFVRQPMNIAEKIHCKPVNARISKNHGKSSQIKKLDSNLKCRTKDRKFLKVPASKLINKLTCSNNFVKTDNNKQKREQKFPVQLKKLTNSGKLQSSPVSDFNDRRNSLSENVIKFKKNSPCSLHSSALISENENAGLSVATLNDPHCKQIANIENISAVCKNGSKNFSAGDEQPDNTIINELPSKFQRRTTQGKKLEDLKNFEPSTMNLRKRLKMAKEFPPQPDTQATNNEYNEINELPSKFQKRTKQGKKRENLKKFEPSTMNLRKRLKMAKEFPPQIDTLSKAQETNNNNHISMRLRSQSYSNTLKMNKYKKPMKDCCCPEPNLPTVASAHKELVTNESKLNSECKSESFEQYCTSSLKKSSKCCNYENGKFFCEKSFKDISHPQELSIKKGNEVSNDKKVLNAADSCIVKPEACLIKQGSVFVLFTGDGNDSVKEIVSELGGTTVHDVHIATHLVANKVIRTIKFMAAIGKGLPIVTKNWLIESKRSNRFLDCTSYLLNDRRAERRFSFDLRKTLEQVNMQPLLKEWKIFVTKNVKPPPKQLKIIIEAAGGKVLKTMPTKRAHNVFIISNEEDSRDCRNAFLHGFAVVDVELILSGLLEYKLDFKKYKITSQVNTVFH